MNKLTPTILLSLTIPFFIWQHQLCWDQKGKFMDGTYYQNIYLIPNYLPHTDL